MADEADDGWCDNPGFLPGGVAGKRVAVELRNGRRDGEKPVSTTAKAGWDADSARWSLEGNPADIIRYKVL